MPTALSSLAVKVSRDEASTTTLGNAFQCLTTLTVEEFFLPGISGETVGISQVLNKGQVQLTVLYLCLSNSSTFYSGVLLIGVVATPVGTEDKLF